ncbi:hypothetical protein [Jatrophihabitans endophyticus]|uniref:hypothetical protein n=1 Tax=Jatrophihabitans endophyticus TaxID=1206085 RepID=UPI0019E3AF09|nr:hypothetical protein [Jatrophihabitans endophyticus]MBE7187291.1 hypothetical protein [Jatrophihabitans endophyticus]
MMTETELRDVLQDIAAEAPSQCTSLNLDRPGPRRFFVPGAAAAAVVLIAAGVTTAALLNGSGPRPSQASRPSSSRVQAPAAATGSTPTRPSQVVPSRVPNAKQRRQLLKYALHDATINGDPHPTVHVVWTTFDRAYTRLPMSFHIGPEAKEARQFRLSSTHAAVWVIWYQGHFDQGNDAMADLVGADLKGGMGTFDVDAGDGVNPDVVLAPLGKVVRLS